MLVSLHYYIFFSVCGPRVQPPRLLRALVLRVRRDVTHDARGGGGVESASPRPPAPPAAFQPTPSVRALVHLRLGLVGTSSSTSLRN